MKYQSPDEVLEALVNAYYTERNVEDVLTCVTDDIEWIGTENNDSACGKEELKALLEADVQFFPDAFEVDLEEPKVQPLGEDAVMITVVGKQVAEPGKVAGFIIRGSTCIIRTEDGWKINHIHVSVPNAEREKISLQNKLNIERQMQTTLLNHMQGGIAMYRLKKSGEVILEYISHGLATLCGYDSSQEMIQSMKEHLHEYAVKETSEHVNAMFMESAMSGKSISTIVNVLCKDGKPIYLNFEATSVNNEELCEDDLAVFYAIETKLSDEAIQAKYEQDYYRTILDITRTTYFEIDDKQNFYYSDSFNDYKVSEYGVPAVMGSQEAMSCFDQQDLEKVRRLIHQVSVEERGEPVIVRMLMKDGTYQWTEINAHVQHTPDHKIHRMTGIMRRVNEEWEKQKKEMEEALYEARVANQAKTNFLSRVSHDMRTPLNGILGLTALLKSSTTDNSALRDLSELEVSGHYLLDLINDTLDISRIESGKLELHPVVYDGRMIFNNSLRLAKINAKAKNIKLSIQAEDIPFTLLYVDVGRIEQVVLNVVSNAIKFTPNGGEVDVVLKNVSVEDDVITDELIISDTGIGMSEDFLPHIFEAFSQEDTSTTTSAQGTGLGMAITKQLLTLMGGDIKVESEIGKGSTFTITLKLPIATDEQREEWNNSQSTRTDLTDLHGKRVLVCEDHPLNTQIATRILEAKNMIVEHAENGKIGLDMFNNSPVGYYDVVLMDIRMPVMDGIEAAQQIRLLKREDAKAVPIIAMTANAFAEDIEKTRKAGMDAHLSKPIQPKVLFDTIAKALNVQNDVRRQKILVVDDIEVNRVVIRACLEEDYEILEATNGKEAMDIIEKTRDLDAVITDIQMPEMDGITLITTIRKNPKYRHLVIIANTQFGDPEQEEQLLALGANDFVYKPTTSKIVEIRVRNALSRTKI